MAIGAILGVASAVRAGLAYVELDTDDDPLIKGLNRARAQLANWGVTIARAGAGITAAGAGIVAPIVGLFTAAVEHGATIDTLARQMGTTTEQVSKLAYAFEASGVEMNDFVDITKTLDQQIAAVRDGSDDAARNFRLLGLSAQQLAALPLDERLELVGQRLSEVTNAGDRTNLALKLLGGQGNKALRLFANGNAELNRLTQQAGDVGAVLGGATAADATKVWQAWNEVAAAFKYAGLAIGEALLPQADTIKDFASRVVSVLGAVRKWTSENKNLVLGTVAFGTALLALGGTLAGLGVAITASGVAIGGLLVVVKATAAFIAAAVGALFTPLGLITVALGAGVLAWTQWTDSGRAVAAFLGGELGGAFSTLKDTAVEAWGGIVAAIGAGDLQGAWAIVLSALSVTWEQTVATFRNTWDAFRDYFVGAWDDISVKVGAVWDTFRSAMQPTVDAWNATMDVLSEAWKTFSDYFTSVWETTRDWFTGVWQAMVSGFKTAFMTMIAAVLGPTLALAQAIGLDDLVAKLGNVVDVIKEVGADIGRDYDAAAAKRAEAAAKAKTDRDAQREADRQARQDAVAAAQQRLKDMIAAQAQARWDNRAFEVMGPPKPKGAGAPDFGAPSRIIKSLFAATGNLTGVLGLGSTAADPQVRATQKVEDAVRDVGAKIDKLGPRFS